jgi:hypothetical protein
MMPMQTMPTQPQTFVAPQPWPPKAPPMPAPPTSAGVEGQPKWRGKIELDAPPDPLERPLVMAPTPPPPLALPSPEEAGVAAPRWAAKVDWNAIRDRLQQLGGVGLQLAQLSDGSYRVAFEMRTTQANYFHHIEATAATEHEAVSVALWRAEQWASGK